MDANGDADIPISVILHAPLDHPLDMDTLSIPLVVAGTDTDGTPVAANVGIEVLDAEPVAIAVSVDAVVEGQAGSDHDLLANTNGQMDGAQVDAVNGTALTDTNLITDPIDPNFGFHQVLTQYGTVFVKPCLLYTSPSPRDKRQSRMPSSA